MEEFLKKYSSSRLVIGKKWMSYIDSKDEFIVYDGKEYKFKDFQNAFEFFTKINQ